MTYLARPRGRPFTELSAIVVMLAASLALGESAASPATTSCRVGISRETAERLFAVLDQAPGVDGCKLEGVRTERTSLEASWTKEGAALAPLRVVPRECAPDSAVHAGEFAIEVPSDLAESCPSVASLLGAFVARLSEEAPAGRRGNARDPLFRAARILFTALFVIAAVLFVRGAMNLHSLDPRWIIAGLAAFAAALALRAALPFSLGNWYSEVMPASGPPPWMRFGPGFFAFQSLLRDAGLWSSRTLAVSQLLLGALAVPLLLGALRELRAPAAAIAAALVLFVLAPFHVRLSATTSEHVLASTLCLGLLLCWLRAARSGSPAYFAATALLFPAVCAIRVDMTVQALAVLAWPFLRDGAERERRSPGLPPAWMIALLVPLVLATLATAYFLIVLPSQHPTPDLSWHLFALRHFLPQFWAMATNDPPWISLAAVLLAPLGALALAIRRPLLLVRVAGTLLIAFVASGRTFLHDELLGARYFLFAIPVFLVLSGYGLAALLAVVPNRVRSAATGVALAGLALWTAIEARPAYSARYAFEDEYAFARANLGRLPAGCAVYQVQIRNDALPHDVDCCLDLARSPLVLDFPELRFADLPDDPARVLTDAPCVAYYEGVACSIAPHPEDRLGHEFVRSAADYFQRRCAEPHRVARLDLLAEATTSPRTTEGFFDGPAPRVRLYRWGK